MVFIRGLAEAVKSLLDLSIIVCRVPSDTPNSRPLSLVCHSKRQVKANVSCSGILEKGTYIIGTLPDSRLEFPHHIVSNDAADDDARVEHPSLMDNLLFT